MGDLREVNIKFDMPTVADAIKRTTYNVMNAKGWGCSAVKLIHGYGSSGTGGKIRVGVHRYLDDKVKKRQIRFYIKGEDFSIFDEDTRAAFALCDALRRDEDLERHNNGITIVVL